MVMSAPPIVVLHMVLFKDSKEPFLALLRQCGVSHEEMMLKAYMPGAAEFFVDIVKSSAPWAAGLTTVICAYLKNKRSRKVIVTTKNKEVIHCEGLGPAEIEAILEHAKSITAIESGQRQT